MTATYVPRISCDGPGWSPCPDNSTFSDGLTFEDLRQKLRVLYRWDYDPATRQDRCTKCVRTRTNQPLEQDDIWEPHT